MSHYVQPAGSGKLLGPYPSLAIAELVSAGMLGSSIISVYEGE